MARRSDDEILPGYVAIGRALAPAGLKGEIKVEPLGPDECFRRGRQVWASGRSYEVLRTHRRERFLYLRLAGVDDRASAEALRGAYLQVPESELDALPEGHYYRFQLIGLHVHTQDGSELGEIADIMSTAESDVFVVRGPLGEVLIPATDEIVQAVDVERGVVTVEAVPGLLAE